MPHPAEHSDGTPDEEQNRSVREGAQAAGGIAAQAGDPTSPTQAAGDANRDRRDMRARGFGDHKGASID